MFEQIKRKSLFKHFSQQFKDVMIILLILVALFALAISIYRKNSLWLESLLILGIILVNTVISFAYEKRAEKSLTALKKVAAPSARVWRDGEELMVKTSELVPGDIIEIEAGDTVPADARLIFSRELRCRDYAVTGEPIPMEKNPYVQLKDSTPLLQRDNMVYAATDVVAGHGKAVVVETGLHCEVAKLLHLDLSGQEVLIGAQISLRKMEKVLGILAVISCIAYFAAGVFIMRQDMVTVAMTALSLAVAIVPESLPAIVGVVLAVSLQRMAKQNAVVRRMNSLETLRNVSVICTHKTGALTSRQMRMIKAWAQPKISLLDDEPLGDVAALIRLAGLCCDAEVKKRRGKNVYVGDPVQAAILTAAEKMGYSKFTLDNTLPRIGVIPFDSVRRLMSTINIIDGKTVAVVKGAPDVLLPKCSHGSLRKARNVVAEMTQSGLSVIAIAYRELEKVSAHPTPVEIEQDLTLAGLVGLEDPVHQSALLAVKKCRAMGIKPVMLTGEDLNTAVAFAKQLRILDREEEGITGQQLRQMTDDDLVQNISQYSVFARIGAEDKVRIVKAWKRKKEIVAITGKRLSDVPALEAADIACALGDTGKDAVKNNADLILTDDSFATVVDSIQFSQGIFENIRKAIRFLLGCNLGELLSVFTALVAGWGIPFLPVQLLWINLVTDSFPAIALATEKPEPTLTRSTRRRRHESIFAGSLGIYAVLEGAMFGALTVAAYVLGRFYLPGASPDVGQSMAFAVLAFSQIVHAHNVRSKVSVFRVGLFSNPLLWGASLLSAGLVLAVMLTPLRTTFRLDPLTQTHWIWVAAFSLIPGMIMEIAKIIRYAAKRRRERKRMLAEIRKRKEESGKGGR